MSDDLALHVDTATDALDGLKQMRDFRTRYIHVGVGAVHAICALALALDRLAQAITPKENP